MSYLIFNAVVGGTIVAASSSTPREGRPVLSLIFAEGQRPDCARLAALRSANGAAALIVTHQPPPDEGWLELLHAGMAVDCRGLAPAAPSPLPLAGPMLGLGHHPDGEAIALLPGPHLADAAGLVPVVRAIAAIGAALAELPGLLAVCWDPAHSWMAPAYFRKVVGDWLGGGPFPVLGLTSLDRGADGAMHSIGLAFLIGQEVLFPPGTRLQPALQARIAVRLINDLIAHGPLVEPEEFVGPGGEAVVVAPVDGGARLRVMVRQD